MTKRPFNIRPDTLCTSFYIITSVILHLDRGEYQKMFIHSSYPDLFSRVFIYFFLFQGFFSLTKISQNTFSIIFVNCSDWFAQFIYNDLLLDELNPHFLQSCFPNKKIKLGSIQ